jgi:hypothetical protein
VDIRTVQAVVELSLVEAQRRAAVFELLDDACDVYGVFAVEELAAILVAPVPLIEAVGLLDLLADGDYCVGVEWL